MGTSDGVGKFLYWSDRAIRSAAEDNGVELQGKRHWSLELNVKMLKAATEGRERVTRDRLSEARRLERALGRAAVEDFDTEPGAAFIKGVGTVNFAKFNDRYAENDGVLMHIQIYSSHGRRVDLCLFGSMDNVRGFGHDDNFNGGWTSSAAPAIGELLATKGRENAAQRDDDESRAVESLKIALYQGSTGSDHEHAGSPQTRGLTVGHASESEFFAEVYTDVVLDPQRWDFHTEEAMVGAERIIVGRALWVRSMSPASVVRYAELRNGPRWARWWWLYRLQRRFRRRPPAVTASPGMELLETGEVPPRPPESPGRQQSL